MINLDSNTAEIEEFIQSSIDGFISTHQTPKSIGIYCCPWAGWLTTNFNINKTPKDTGNNCPDFEFVEFGFLELDGWQEEYESEHPSYKINGRVIKHDHNSGDEKLNELIFKYLEPTVGNLKKENSTDFLLQMLDSNFVRTF